jgi:hypothetical protein
LISSLANKPVNGFLFPDFENPAISVTEGDGISVGMGPYYWFSRMVSSSTWFRLYPSIGQGWMFHSSLWGDRQADTESYWKLFDENGQVIQTGDTSGTTGEALGRTHYLPYAGIYKLFVPYDGYYYINGMDGYITTTLDFDTTRADSDPPYIQHFKVLSGGRVSNSLLEGLVNSVEFDLLDDKSSIASATLFVKPFSGAADYQQVPVDITDTRCTAQIPNLGVDDFVSMKLIAEDTAGNQLTTEWDVAFYYQMNPGVPVADAGADQKITADQNSDTAGVTLNGSVSYDPDGVIASYLWKEGQAILGNSATIDTALSVGTHDITLTVTDNDGLSSTDTTQVVIEAAKVGPVADAGADKDIEAEYGSETAAVTIDGSASYDPDGSIVSYLWKEGETILGNSAMITTELGIGTHDITLTVTDNDGLSSTDTTRVVVTQKALSDKNIYVKNIKMNARKKGKYWTVTAVVSIFDCSGNPVKSANISGNWSGSVTKNVSKVTYSSGKRTGKAKFTLTRIKQGGTFTFTVNNVAKSGLVYNNELNVETSDTVEIASPTTIHVKDIKMQARKKGKYRIVTAVVTIFDNTNAPVKSANITGNWSGSVAKSVSKVTYSRGKKRIGKATFKLGRIKKGGTFTFTVNNVKKSGLVYNDELNIETSDTIVIQ